MQIVDAPVSEPAEFGLFSLPGVVEHSDEDHFSESADYEMISCRANVSVHGICDNTKTRTITTRSNSSQHRQYGFGIVVEDRCSTMSGTKRDGETKALAQMELCTQKAVENELWTGGLATAENHLTNHWLASSTATDVTPAGGPVKVRYGLALLEKALGDMGCGNKGVIHVTRDVGSVLPTHVIDSHLETSLGNYVVAGVGYTGSSPTGTAATATSTWIYATGAMKVILGNPYVLGDDLAQRVARDTNDLITYVERGAWVDFDSCGWFAVNVNLALDFA